MDFYKECFGAAVTWQERELMKKLAEKSCERYDQPVIVNIGVMWGCSMHCFRAGCERAILVGVDIDFDTRKVQKPELLNAIFIQGDSREIHEQFSVQVTDEEHKILYDSDRIDLLFIDGDHRYLTVKKDIAGWEPKVSQGGIMAFHDYAPAQVDLDRDPSLDGVRKAVDEWFKVNNHYWKELPGVNSIRVFQRSYTGD